MLATVLFTVLLAGTEVVSRNAPACKCEKNQFTCGAVSEVKCSCVPIVWKCDGEYDCGDYSDEADCEMPKCDAGLYQCSNGKCIAKDWQCDGVNDCSDDSDEQNCPKKACDETAQITCKDGQCIPNDWGCDGDEDCSDGSDEQSCKSKPCQEDEFKCSDGGCIGASLYCDGDFDCKDGSDEECDMPIDDTISGNFTCKQDEFSCGDENGFAGDEMDPCVPIFYLCDGDMDCLNGVDEQNCTRPCTSEEYRCDNRQCINLQDHCDGIDDCGDGSDENECPEHEACLDGEYQCDNGLCISRNWRCDGDSDCKDGSDEERCTDGLACDKDQFQCHTSRRCILAAWRCDGEKDCDDESDELHCDCGIGQYLCASGQCIGASKLCNRIPDCIDGSDERPVHSCNHSMVFGSNATSCDDDKGGCEHICKQASAGQRIECACNLGYRLAPDMHSCVDIDECAVDGSCSQTCNNTVGSFSCSCLSGYLLRPDKRTCKASGPAATLLFTNRIDIRKMNPDHSELKPILRDLENAIGLDYHIEKGLVFWSDVTLDRIMRSNVNGTEIQEVVSSGLESPGGVAVDWIHDLLYWTDSRTSRIEVSYLDGANRKVVIWENLQKPRALALHPLKSLMFWTDWGNTPCLESAAMDGSMRRSVASRNVYWPNGLTIDYTNNHIYWSDAKFHIIETANLDGGHRRAVVSRGLPHPFGITIFEDKVYWTDWQTKSVNSANKFTGRGVKTISKRLHFPMDIRTYHPLRQPKGINRCLHANCSHLSLPRPDGCTCACPTGFRRVNTTHCAEDIERFLVFTRKSDIRRISFDGDERADIVLPLENLKNAVALDWHSGHPGYIYWSDVATDTISRSEWDGRNQKVLISSSLDSPAGIAIDWITNKMYWTDSGINRIEVSTLDGSMRCVLVWTGLDRPRAIIVHPKTGHMFWTDWGREPKIERAGMDGSNRTTIVSTQLMWPNGIALDHTMERLYWVDAGKKVIEFCDLEGKGRRILIERDLPHPFGIAMDDGKIYWTDWTSQSISYANKSTGLNRGVLRKDLPYLMDIRYYHNARPKSPNPCSMRNGGCSHLCLLAPNPDLGDSTDRTAVPYSCACPSGLTLGPDKRNCDTEMKKFLAVARRSDIRVISLDVDYSADVKLNIDTYMTNVVDVAVDPIEDDLYWSDIGSRTISRTSLSTQPGVEEVVIGSGLDTVDGLAVDVIGRMLYWTDDGRNTITASTLDGKYRRILISKNLDSPRAIALHYSIGYMYWTDWGNNPTAKIERAGMDGSDRSVIISSGLIWPNGITIDYQSGWIIWGDAQHEKIERSDLLGKDRKTIHSSVPHPYSLTSLDGFLYWTDWQTRNIERMNLRNLTQVKTIRENMLSMMGIKAVSMEKVPSSRCGDNNGGCSHLCLRSPKQDLGYACACPTGIRIHEDGKTCSNLPREYLLFTTRLSIRRTSLEADQSNFVELPVGNLENAIALDYHYGQQLLFFSDVYLDVIKRAHLNGSNVQTIVSKNLKTVDGLTVDWIANNLYWTDSGPNTISVSRLDGSSRKVIIDKALDEPRALSVHPTRGALFWTDWGGKARIEKSYLDGTGRKILVKKHIHWPNGLTIDFHHSRIFWVDAHHVLSRIETCDFNGRNREVVISPVPHGFAITYLYNTLYWTDWQTKNIHSAVLPLGKSKRKSIIKGVVGLMGIKTVSASRQTGANPCDATTGYGGCTHLCLMRGPRRYVCACPDPVPDDADSEDDYETLEKGENGPSSKPRNCSLKPVPRTFPFVPTTTKSKPQTPLPEVTTSSVAVQVNESESGKKPDMPVVIHLVAAFVGAAVIVFFLCAGFGICFCRHYKRKILRSNAQTEVSFRNHTYTANSSSTLAFGSSPRQTPTPSIRTELGIHDARQEGKSLLALTSTPNTVESSHDLEESDTDQGKGPVSQYTNLLGRATVGADTHLSRTASTNRNPGTVSAAQYKNNCTDTPSCALPLLDDAESVEECELHSQGPELANEYALLPEVDEYLKSIRISGTTNSKSDERFLEQLEDKQPKLSVTTTCTMLSEDDSRSISEVLEQPTRDISQACRIDAVTSSSTV